MIPNSVTSNAPNGTAVPSPSVSGWTAAIGKKLLSAKADEYRITLKFEDGITAEITSDGGSGYNEGSSWLKLEIGPSNNSSPETAK